MKIEITGMRGAAYNRCANLPDYRRSIRGREGREVGCMCEIVVERNLSVPFECVYSTEMDLLVVGVPTEIKGKERMYDPQPHYACTVPMYNLEHQNVAQYIFVSITSKTATVRGFSRFDHAFIVGWATREMVLMQSKRWHKGDLYENGRPCREDCLNLRVDQLLPMCNLGKT